MPQASERFTDQTAIVTGGTYGIGAAATTVLLTEGARVVVVARGTKPSEIDSDQWSGRVRLVNGDISEPDTSAAAVRCALDWTGSLDILVNNAALDHTGPLLATSVDAIRRIFQVNVLGTFFMLQCAASEMRVHGGGAIVNVTSRLAVAGVPTMVLYGASKGAVLSLTRGAAVELAPYNIRVNAVAPGLTETTLVAEWLQQQTDPEATRHDAAERIPQKRFCTPTEVAAAIAFLASGDAAHITGASLAVDGGYTAA